jgi:ATP-binding cassette, subfamily G (WHITE), member 2, PDR
MPSIVATLFSDAMIRGLSGGEKRRTSLAEALISGAPFQAWDSSTRGLDSATALNVVKLLRKLTKSLQSTVLIAVYQASEDMYEVKRYVPRRLFGHMLTYAQ